MTRIVPGLKAIGQLIADVHPVGHDQDQARSIGGKEQVVEEEVRQQGVERVALKIDPHRSSAVERREQAPLAALHAA